MSKERTPRTIWIVSKYASSAEYGFESRLFALAREFRKLGRDVVIISSDSNHLARFPRFARAFTKETVGGCDVWWIKTLKYSRSVSVRRVLSWLDFEAKLLLMPKGEIAEPDVIIVSSLSLLTILSGLLMRRRYGCALVFEVRDIWPLTLVEEGGYGGANPIVRALGWVEKVGYRGADVVVGTMPNLAEHVRKVAGEGIRCECVPFGYDPRAYEAEDSLPAGFVERYIPKGKFIVGYAGSIGLTNALETVVQCARELSSDERFHFIFLGNGDLRERFLLETRDARNITFVPRVARNQVQGVIGYCDVLYFAVKDSRVWRYGMSLNKLVDYLMAGKPVVASYSGYPSIIDEAGCGAFVPAGDVLALKEELLRMAGMPREDLVEMGLSGKKWLMEHRTWSALAREYLSVLDAIER